MTDAGKEMLHLAEYLEKHRHNDPHLEAKDCKLIAACLRSASAPSVKPDCAEIERATIERCAKAAHDASLPEGYRWGYDAMEQFYFAKRRCVEAILALSVTGEARESSAPQAEAIVAGGVRAVSSIDFQQQRGRYADIIQEAIQSYDDWMLDDDYESNATLRRIINRMRDRFFALPAPEPQRGTEG